MLESASLEVLETKLSAHAKHDELQFSNYADKISQINDSIVSLEVKVSSSTTRLHARFDALFRGVLTIALIMIGTLGMIIYNTLVTVPG